MSVVLDKYVGYIMDISEDLFKGDKRIRENIYEKCIYDCDDSFVKELLQYGFICEYQFPNPTTNNITILYDGMSGQYIYLIYILEVNRNSYDDDEPSETINRYLKTIQVPDEIKEKLNKVYEYLFEKPCNIQINMQQVYHYH